MCDVGDEEDAVNGFYRRAGEAAPWPLHEST